MSKKFYIGICCLALLATSVASGYSEDFEGYTGNVGEAWDGTTEFATSGWGDLYRLMEEWGDTSRIGLGAGYRQFTQGVGFPGVDDFGAARLLPSPQGPNSTFVYTAMVDFQGGDVGDAGLFFGTDELVTGTQAEHDGWFWVYLNGDSVMVQYGINTDTRDNTGWISNVFEWGTGGWVEHKIEADTNENARPTTVRYYYRDLEEDGSGPVGDGSWIQVDLGGAGGGVNLDMTGDDYQIEAIGFSGRAGVFFDNLVATVDVPFVELTFTFVQMCDTQLGFGGYENDVARFEQAVKQINTLKPDFVVICGDLVDNFDDDDDAVADFKRIKAGFAVPCYCAPGNHDVGNVPTIASLKRYRTLMGKDYYSFEHKGYAFVITNSQLWDRYLEGESEKQDSWLKETLKAASKKGSPIFVVGHYPLFRNTADEKRGYYMPVEKRNELLSLFEAHGVVAVLTGHAHRTIIKRYKDIQLVTGETTSKNFDKRPFGFRLWRVTESKPAEHEFVPLQNRVTESKSAEHEFVPLQN